MTRPATTRHAMHRDAAPNQVSGPWRTVEVRAWRQGCRPARLIGLNPDLFSDDFDFDPMAIDENESVEFLAAVPVGADVATQRQFGFSGADGNTHWIACDTPGTAVEIWPRHDAGQPGQDAEFGTDGDETGVFYPETGGALSFGRPGQPTLADIMTGRFVPPGGKGAVIHEGSFQVDGDDPDLEVCHPTQALASTGLPLDRPGPAACLAPDALVVTPQGMTPLSQIVEGAWLRTGDHGWQQVTWLCWPTKTAADQPAFLATKRGIPVSPSHSTGRILLMTGRFSSPSARVGGRADRH